MPTTQIGQSEWIIPNEYYTSGDTVIVSHNSTVLDSTMYTLSESGGVVKVTIQNTTDLPIDKNSVYLVIFHNKIPDPQFTIYDKTLLTNIVSQKTWTIDTPNFDSTKDSVLVIYNTTLLSNNEYTIVGDKLTLLIETNEAIDKNTVSVFVFSNSRPLGGNYTLPIATKNTLGGIKPDGVTLSVDPLTGIASVISSNGGSLNFKQQLLITTQNSQQTWDIPFTNFDKDKDLLIVTHNTTVIPTDKYSITTEGSTQKLNLLFTTPNEIQDNNVFLIMIKGGTSEGSSINLPISANDVSETTTKQFIEGTLKSQITSNTSTLNNQELRLSNVESTIANISTSDEKVKLNALGTSGYLEDFIDNSTLVISNNKLAVNSLQGLTATVSEINSLQGVNGNIQAQINSLNAIGNFSTTVMTYSELESILNPKPQDMVIVLSDETHSGNSTIYIYNGSSWIYSGDFKGGEVRDFKTNPIDLSTETNGVLQKSKYEKQNASETSISDTNNNFTATNVEDALVELFQYVNSGKSGVATSIGYPLSSSDNFSIMVDKINILKNSFSNNLTKKGVITYNYEPLSQMIDKIPSIPNVTISTGVNTVSKLNVTTPYQYKLVLKEPIPLEKIATSVLSYVGNDSGIVHYEVNYNNSDASNFDYDKDKVVFDGVMKLRDTWTYILNSLGNNYYESEFINISNFSDIGSINILTENLEISALEDNAQIVKANGDISLNSVDSIDKLTLIGNSVNNGVVKITMSFDGGITWNYFDNLTSSWKTLDINNTIDFKNNGMTIDTLNNLNSQQLKDIRNNSEILRFAYYLERNSFLDNAFVDKLTVLVTMLGYNTLANFTDYNYSYDLETKTISYNFLKNGTYTINYVDGN